MYWNTKITANNSLRFYAATGINYFMINTHVLFSSEKYCTAAQSVSHLYEFYSWVCLNSDALLWNFSQN